MASTPERAPCVLSELLCVNSSDNHRYSHKEAFQPFLRLRSRADPTRTAQATISVSALRRVTVAISPASVALRTMCRAHASPALSSSAAMRPISAPAKRRCTESCSCGWRPHLPPHPVDAGGHPRPLEESACYQSRGTMRNGGSSHSTVSAMAAATSSSVMTCPGHLRAAPRAVGTDRHPRGRSAVDRARRRTPRPVRGPRP